MLKDSKVITGNTHTCSDPKYPTDTNKLNYNTAGQYYYCKRVKHS